MKTERYIPTGSRLCVTPKGKEATWHTTKEDIVLKDDPQPTTCPRTGRSVQTITHKGLAVFFLADQVRERQVPAKGDLDTAVANHLRVCLLYYDIPERAEVDNPSGYLRRIAIRVNLSCWIVPEASIPYALIHRLTEAGADVNVVRFDASEGRNLIGMAIKAMKKELADTIARAQQSKARADTQYTEAKETEKACDYYVRRAEAIKERLDKLVEDFTEAAKLFGINPRVLELSAAATAAAAIQTSMRTRAGLFAQAAEDVKKYAGRNGKVLSDLATQDQVPAGILADAIEDGGGDATALREAFGPEAGGSAPSPNGTPAEEDHVFSLTGVDAE